MIRIGLCFLGLFIATLSFAQGVGINADGSQPDPSAILDAKSTTQGVLFPRMTNEQRDQISNPAEGLMIFNTQTGRINYFYNDLWYEVFGSIIPNQNCQWSQDFTGLSSLPTGWTTSHPSQWTVYSSNQAGGISPELRFRYYSTGFQQFWVRTEWIDMGSCSNLELSFKHYVWHYIDSFNLRIQTSTNGTTWVNRATQTVIADVGPTTWTVDLSAMNGQSFYLRFVFDGDELNIFEWHIDDIIISGN